MGRRKKQGLDTFPLDVDFFEDDKITSIVQEFGVKGAAVALKLLTVIYKHGYYIEWNEATRRQVLVNLPGVTASLCDEIVRGLAKCGFFNRSVFSQVGILTSKGIQKRYFESTRRRHGAVATPYLIVGIGDENDEVSDVDLSMLDSGMDEDGGPSAPYREDEQQWCRILLGDQSFTECCRMRYHVSDDDIVDAMRLYDIDNRAKDLRHQTFTDYRRHAYNWMRIHFEEKHKQNDNDNGRNRRTGTGITATGAQDYATEF